MVGTEVGIAVGAVMVSVLTGVHTVGDTHTRPAKEQTQKEGYDMCLRRGLPLDPRDDRGSARWACDLGGLGSNLYDVHFDFL